MMEINQNILEDSFRTFTNLLIAYDGKPFLTFKGSQYVNEEEGYKYEIYKKAQRELNYTRWMPEDIGTGTIQRCVSSAIHVVSTAQRFSNNLIDWRKKDHFSKLPIRTTFEQTLFDLYNDQRKDSECFEELIREGLSYQVIAYLFFMKDSGRFAPISQQRFDRIFERLGIGFRSSRSVSWDNYMDYVDLIKQTRDFLRTKDAQTALLDAHSFLWILGDHLDGVPKTRINASTPTTLTCEEWTDILLDCNLTTEFDLGIFRALYSFEDHKAPASEIAELLKITHPPLNLEIGRYAKRIAAQYSITFTERNEQQDKYWDLFFNGWSEGSKFVWQLKPELTKALEQNWLAKEENLAEEFPGDPNLKLYEGAMRLITVNSYERNAQARALCIRHWKTICGVCEFDFEKRYGEIGKGYIHVHHLTQIHEIGTTYQIDPQKDLIPVCPNCHAMLHKRNPPYTIEELKQMLR